LTVTGQLPPVDWTVDRLRLTSWPKLSGQLADSDGSAGERWL